MKTTLLNGTIIFICLICSGVTVFSQRVGGYKSVAADDERVVAAADFAVSKRVEEHSEQEGLKLDAIKKAELQVVAGTNYRLCLSVKLEDETQQVKVVVYQNLKKEYSLTSWTVEDCAENESNKISSDNDLKLQKITYSLTFTTDIPNCSSSQLSLSEADGDADMGGKRFGNYVFTNISSSSCSLSGFPSFILLDKLGRMMRGVKILNKNSLFSEGEENENKPPLIKLEPKQTAWFQIFYNDGMALDHKKPVPTSAKVKVKAPNTNQYFVIKSEIQQCCGVQISSIRQGLPK